MRFLTREYLLQSPEILAERATRVKRKEAPSGEGASGRVQILEKD